MAVLFILCKTFFKGIAESGFINKGCNLKIEEETPRVHVDRAYKSKTIIN
jgi:hypothetical protein